MQKAVSFKVKGMQRDLSASAFNSEYAYENKNVRIMPTDESTLLSLINEKGTLPTSITGIGDSLDGVPIGQAVIDNELVIFTTKADSSIDSNKDKIYKIWFENNILNGKLMFEGDLGFNYSNPIETLSFYENTDIKRVYWVDGINQPRVINIAAASDTISKWVDTSFDFVQTLELQETISVSRNTVAGGVFAPGVIQYAFTYFNKYGQESNIFYTSPLYYISYNNRGASPEDKVSNSFNIEVVNVDQMLGEL